MQITSTTVRRTVGDAPHDVEPTGQRATARAVPAAAGLAAVAAVVGAVEAGRPVGPGGSSFHHLYPFVIGAVGLLAAVLAARGTRRPGDHAWLRLMSVGGLGYTLNALVIAALTLAVTPGSRLPVTPLAWVEGWLWMPFDVIMIGLLVLLLPGTARRPATVWAARAASVLVGAGMLLNAFAQPVMENTDHVANPLAVPALAGLGDLGDLACLLGLLVAVLAALVRHVGLLVRRDPVGRRVGGRGLPLTFGLIATFVATAALTRDDAPLASNLVSSTLMLLSLGSIVLVGSRLAARA